MYSALIIMIFYIHYTLIVEMKINIFSSIKLLTLDLNFDAEVGGRHLLRKMLSFST